MELPHPLLMLLNLQAALSLWWSLGITLPPALPGPSRLWGADQVSSSLLMTSLAKPL